MVESAAAVARGERHGAMLARLAELGMAMAEAIVEQTAKAGAAEAGAAFAKVSQAVRRAVALEARLAEGLGARKVGLASERAERRSAARRRFETDKREDIVNEIGVAAHERFETLDDADEAVEALRQDAYDLLDSDDYGDVLARPVGESIARLCRALGLDPQHCVATETGWTLKTYPEPLSKFASPPDEEPVEAFAVQPRRPRTVAAAPTGPPR